MLDVLQSQHLTKIRRTVVTDEIVKRLVSLILEQKLRPGDKLPSERALMEKFGVGRSSLRESIKSLTALGVVEVSVGEGMFVGRGEMTALSTPLSWALLMNEGSTREVINARRIIEVELAGLAAASATDDEIGGIRTALEAMRANVGESAEVYSRLDLEFHLALARAAHNRVLYHVLDTLRQIMRVWIVEVITGYEDRFDSYNEHVPVFEAIRTHDVPAARAAMAKHLQSVGDRLLAAIATEQSADQADPPAQPVAAG